MVVARARYDRVDFVNCYFIDKISNERWEREREREIEMSIGASTHFI